MDIKTRIDHIEYNHLVKHIPISNAMPELDLALRSIINANNTVLEMYRQNITKSEKKQDGSPVTEADLASHRILTNDLSKSKHPILSEEQENPNIDEADTIWIIDPLDGTSHFVNGTGEFTIMISLVKKTVPILGVILWPLGNTIFAAQKEKGAYRYQNRCWSKITVTDTNALSECRMVGSKHHLTEEESAFIKSLKTSSFVSIGSSLKVGMISSGEAEAYITTTNKMKVWDTAASHCIITEAGGKMTDVNGDELLYGKDDIYHHHGILATNGVIHDKIIKKFAMQLRSE